MEARLFTLLWSLVPAAGRPASLAFRFELGEHEAWFGSPLTEVSDMVKALGERSVIESKKRARPGLAAGEALTFVLITNSLPHDPPPHTLTLEGKPPQFSTNSNSARLAKAAHRSAKRTSSACPVFSRQWPSGKALNLRSFASPPDSRICHSYRSTVERLEPCTQTKSPPLMPTRHF